MSLLCGRAFGALSGASRASTASASALLQSSAPYGGASPSSSSRRAASTVHVKEAPIPIAKYGGRHTVTMMPGDGIGPEMMGYVREIFKVAGAPVDFETVELDPKSDNYDDLYNAISSVKRNGVGIKGNIETKLNRPNIKSRNVEMRNELDLFVNVIKCQSQAGVKTRHDGIDIVAIRQNTEGEYAMLEHENVPGVVESLKIVTETSTERLCRFAFDYAVQHGRKKVTTIHKAVRCSRQITLFYFWSFVEHHEIDGRPLSRGQSPRSQRLPAYRAQRHDSGQHV